MRRRSILSAWLLWLAIPSGVRAWPVVIHYRLPDILRNDPSVQPAAVMPAGAAIDQFRADFYKTVVALAPADLKDRFLKRYPTPAAFTAEAFKDFLGMSALHRALGFDAQVETAGARGGQPRSILDWVRIGSICPDEDRRNQDRWWVVKGQIRQAADGQRVPRDPVVLNMGAVEGLAGQAHAHYALNSHEKSDDPAVLKSRPADFAVRAGFAPAPVLTFAPQRAQAYCDVALIARHLNQPALAALFAGNGFHYLGDSASQIHTIQVGIYEFFVDAKLQAWKLNALTLGGLLGHTMDFRSIGLDILTNHHTWSEEMLRVALARADAGQPSSTALGRADDLFQPDAPLEAAWANLPHNGTTLLEITKPIIAAGNIEGPEIYRLVRDLTIAPMRQAGNRIDFDRRPDSVVLSYLKPGIDPRMLARFFDLERTGTRRAATAIAFWWRTRYCDDHPEMAAITARLLRQQLDELDQADARREVWLRMHGGSR